jgi:hypothetical protein
MPVRELLRWQWDGYTRYHQSRANLVLHIFVVPLFLVGNIALVVGLARASWLTVLFAVVAMVVSVALQGRGHGKEEVASVPFDGPANAVLRIFLEQWVTFPRFVLSGGWLAALRGEAPPPA